MFCFTLFIATSFLNTFKFDCNKTIQIQIPNFTITSFFLRELYKVNVSEISTFVCSGSRFTRIEPAVFLTAANLIELDLSNNNITNIQLNNKKLSRVDLKNNMLGPKSSITTEGLSLSTLKIAGNLLTDDSKILNEKIQVDAELDLSGNLLRQLSKDRFKLVDSVLPKTLDLSKNLITSLDEKTLKIMNRSKSLIFCPQIRDVACIENTDNAKKQMEELLKRAGDMDVSCLAMELPQCGQILVGKNSNRKGSLVKFEITFPDLKKVYLGEGIKLQITSPYLEPTIIDVKTESLVSSRFSTSIPLSKNIEGDSEILSIEIEEVIDGEDFVDPLNPKISFFIFKSGEKITVEETNDYIRSKKDGFKKIINRGFKPSSVLARNTYQRFKPVLICGLLIASILIVYLFIKFKTRKNNKMFSTRLQEKRLSGITEKEKLNEEALTLRDNDAI